MRRKLTVTTLSAVCVALAASPALAATTTTVVGQLDQGNIQGANSSQSGVNGTGNAPGETTVSGTTAPVLDEASTNASADGETIGTGGGSLIAGTGGAFTQANETATNSTQAGQNGDNGTGIVSDKPLLSQDSTNATFSSELIAATGNTVLIDGGDAQASSIGINSAQSGHNYTGGSPGPLTQSSGNIVINAIILGG